MNRYRLLPKYQRRPSGRPHSQPVSGIVFVGSDVVETELDLSKWVGVLITDRVATPKTSAPAPVVAPFAPVPVPDVVALADGLTLETELVPYPAAESETESEAEPEPEPAAESESEAEPEPESESEAEPEPESGSVAKPKRRVRRQSRKSASE